MGGSSVELACRGCSHKKVVVAQMENLGFVIQHFSHFSPLVYDPPACMVAKMPPKGQTVCMRDRDLELL